MNGGGGLGGKQVETRANKDEFIFFFFSPHKYGPDKKADVSEKNMSI